MIRSVPVSSPYESSLRLGVRRARQCLAEVRSEHDAHLSALFRRDVAALRFGRHDRLDDLLEWLGVPCHEPLKVEAPGARLLVIGGAAADKRPSLEAAQAFLAEGRTIVTSAENADLAAELAPALAPSSTSSWTEAPEARSWSTPEASGWSRPEKPSWSAASESAPATVEAPKLAWALGDLSPAWVTCEQSFGGDAWVSRGDSVVAASAIVGEGRVFHLGGALLSWSPPPAGEQVPAETLGIDDPEHDGGAVDEHAFRVGVTAGALLLESVLAATRA